MSVYAQVYDNRYYYLVEAGLTYYFETFCNMDDLKSLINRRQILGLEEDSVVISTPELKETLGIEGVDVVLSDEDSYILFDGFVNVNTKFISNLVEYEKKDFSYLNEYSRYSSYRFNIINAVVNRLNTSDNERLYYLVLKKLCYKLDYEGRQVELIFPENSINHFSTSLYSFQESLGHELRNFDELDCRVLNPYLYCYLFNELHITVDVGNLSVLIDTDRISVNTLKELLFINQNFKLKLYINFLETKLSSNMLDLWLKVFEDLDLDGNKYFSNIDIYLILGDVNNKSELESIFKIYFQNVLICNYS